MNDVKRNSLHCVGVELAAAQPRQLARFYTDALSFRCVAESDECIDLTLGECLLRLRPAHGRSMPADSASHDHWFRHLAVVVRDMAEAYRHLQKFSAQCVSVYPQTLPVWNKASSGIEAFYLRDPEGHPVELIHFPPDKGRAQWNRPGAELFQGVDHTAIVVASASSSIAFYRDLAQLSETAVAHNYGIEQERLSGVEGADLRATSLGGAVARAPNLELLEYAAPRDGRPMPDNTCRDDAWWSASIFDFDAQEDAASVGRSSQAAELVDPDGHRVVLL